MTANRDDAASRREFLAWLGGAAAVSWLPLLPGCGDESPGGPPELKGSRTQGSRTQGSRAPAAAPPAPASLAPAPTPAAAAPPALLRRPTGLVYVPTYKEHLTGEGHPESPARLDAVIGALSAAGLLEQMRPVAPRAATDEEILGCHTRTYLETVKRDVAAQRGTLSTGDTQISARSLEVARLAAGGVLAAVDAVVTSAVKNAFCALRPPGHHAGAAKGMGFCIFNNVAAAARYAQRRHRIGRVLIVDWDVHHGNGTQDIFYADGSVFYFSTHQSPWYPGTGPARETGTGQGQGMTLNCPFPAGAGRTEIVGAFKDKLAPAMKAFRPELVLISSGFDSRLGDPLGRFTLTDEDFAELTALMLELARTHAQGRLISVLEGGYNLDGLGKAAAAHVKALQGA